MNNPHRFSPGTHAEWHAGEEWLQKSAGSHEQLAAHAARVFLPYLAPQLREFFPLLPFVALSFIDVDGNPWGTLLPGKPGFVWSPEPTLVRVERLPPQGDPLAASLHPGCQLGLLGIELPTRRRNRVNGVVIDVDTAGFTMRVQQAYGNCPRYIQQRACSGPKSVPNNVRTSAFRAIDDSAARTLLSETDTAFVATYGPGPEGHAAMDMSHRGGLRGFIHVDDDGCITVPDFPGNHYFNTLGNIHSTRRAALVVPSFDSGDVLLLSGEASICLPGETDSEMPAIAGIERLWRLRPQRGCWLYAALPLEFEFKSWSLQSLAIGTWA